MSSDKEGVEMSSDEEEVMSNRQRRKLQLQRKSDAEDTATLAEPSGPARTAGTDASRGAVGDAWAHDQQPPMTGPCEVKYCPTCGMPFEYCEFSGAACSKQEEEHVDGAAQQQQHVQQLASELQEKAVIQETKRASGKDKSKETPGVVKICSFFGREHTNNKMRCVSSEVKPDLVAKAASKYFACGASFQKGQPGQAPFVEIQGGVEEKVTSFLEKQFLIPVDKIIFLPEK
ncbi:hypothetical protein Esti_004116 [Eimeria stiedai]